MAIIARRVVDENVASTKLVGQRGDGLAIGVDVGDVAFAKDGRMGRVRQPIADGVARFFRDVDECDTGTLPRESLDDGSTDARAASADEDALILEARVERPVFRVIQFFLRRLRIVQILSISPRFDRLRTNSPIPIVHAGASRDVVTVLLSRPIRCEAMVTVSPTLWVKPAPS